MCFLFKDKPVLIQTELLVAKLHKKLLYKAYGCNKVGLNSISYSLLVLYCMNVAACGYIVRLSGHRRFK